MYLISDKLAYGVIYLDEPREITKEEFDKLQDEHKITPEEYEEWDWSEPLYAYTFKFVKFPAPKPVRIPRGVQVFVDASKIKFLSANEMTNQELEYYHLVYHMNDDLPECWEEHYLIADEMLSRGLEHVVRSTCDRVVELIRQHVKEYIKNIRNIEDAPLGDDWRICVKEDTPVITSSGIKLIKEVGSNERTIDGQVKEQLTREYEGEMISFKIAHLGWFDFTPEHPIWTVPTQLSNRKGEKGKRVIKYRSKQVKDEEAYLRWRESGTSYKGHPRFTKWLIKTERPSWKLAKDLKKDDAVFIPKIREKEVDLPEEIYKLAGWYLAEGFPSGNTEIRFSLNINEEEYAKEILDLFRKITKKQTGVYKKIPDKNEIRVEFSDKELHDFLITNFGSGASNKTIPLWVIQSPKEKIRALLSTYWKGDGVTTPKERSLGRWRITTTSKKLAFGIFLLWTRLGKIPSISYKEQFVFGKWHSSWTVTLHDRTRKDYIETDDGYWFPIRKVKIKRFKGTVYNLETTSNVYYIPFKVHNCLAWYSSLKRGKQLKRKDGTPITIQDTKDLALAIVKEMIRRHHEYKKKGITKFTFNKPSTYKKHARELFEWVIKQIGKDKIPWKEELNALPPGMRIEDIDPSYVIGLTDKDLIDLWKLLVRLAEESADSPEEIPENIHDAAVFVGIELYKRGLWESNRGDNILEKAVELEVMEYPTPKAIFQSEDIPEPEGEYITLEDVIKAFQKIGTIRIKGEPYGSYLVGRVVNEGKVPKDHDIDLLVRQKPDPRLVVALKSIKPDWLAKRLHVVFDPNGPLIGYSIPIHGYSLNPLPKELMIKGFGPYRLKELSEKMRIGKPIIGAKPKSGFGKNEFWDPKEMYLEWAKDYLDEGIFVQEKVDGRRMQLHVDKDQDKVMIFTEDRQRDRAKQFPNIVKEIKEKLNCKSCILDGEMLAFKIPPNVSVKSARLKRDNYPLMEREDTACITVGKVPSDFEDKIVYVFYDIMYLDGKPVVDLPYSERFKLLQKVVPKDARYLDIVKSIYVETPRDFLRAVEKMRRANGSEGVVCKAASMTYPVKYKGENRSDAMCKLKNLKEIDVMVWDVIEKKRKETGEPLGNYMYVSVYLVPEDRVKEFQPSNIVEYKGKHYAIIGRSYATNVKCKRGDIITVMPIRIRKYEDKQGRIKYSLHPDRVVPILEDNSLKLFTLEELFEYAKSKNRSWIQDSNEFVSLRGMMTLTSEGWKPVSYITRHYYRGDLIRLRQKLGETIATPKHSILSKDGEWINAKDNPDLVQATVPRISEKDAIHITLTGYEEKDGKLYLIPSLKGQAIWRNNPKSYSGKSWTQYPYSHSDIWILSAYRGETLKALVRVLGAYIAEGSADKNGSSWRVRISNKDRRWLESVSRDLQLISNVKPSWYKEKDGTWQLIIWSKALYDLVTTLSGKRDNKQIPEFVFSLKREYQEEFLRSAWKGDGLRSRLLSYTNCNIKQICGWIILLRMLGKEISISYKDPNEKGWNRTTEYIVQPVKYHTKRSKKGLDRIPYEGYVYDLGVEGVHNFVDALGCVLVSNTWMFPYFKEKRTDKKEPDTLTTVERIAKLGTKPFELSEDTVVTIDLPLCEFYKDKSICPLLKIFGRPRYQLSMLSTILNIEHLKYPVACPIANIRKCVYLKSYYYGYKTYRREPLTEYLEEEIDECEEVD